MNSPLRILYLEDEPKDVELVQATLEAGGMACHITRVEAEPEFSALLEQDDFDLVLADYTLPSFDGISALKIAREIHPEVPFVFVSGTLGEELAVEILKLGATDYVNKTRLSMISPSVRRALHEAEEKTQRKRAEEALRRSEKQLRDLIETIPVMAFSIRPDGSTEFANRRALEYTGLSAEAISARGWQSTVHTDDLENHVNKWRASLASGQPFENEVRHRNAQGEYRWFLVRTVPLRDEQGNILNWYGVLTDIEDRKRAEQARQEIEEQWEAAFESNPTMYFIVDEAGAIVSVNHYGAEQLGYTVSELAGQPVLSLFYGPDRQSLQGHANACFEQPGRMMRWKARKIRKDGTMLWVRETANAVFLQKRLVLLVVCEDITGQKRAEDAALRSEKELRDLIESVPAMMFIALPGPSNVFVSRGWREYTGLSSEDTAGSGWQAAVHPEDMERFMEKWRVCSATAEPFEDEARFRRAADSEYRWFLVRAVPLLDEHGNILKWYGILTDLEDRKRAEALLTGEKRILEMVTKGDSLAQILDSLCRLVEEQAKGALASILLIDDNRLRHGGAPSLPKAYKDAIDGVAIGPAVGSCGTAAYSGQQVIVEDIATDPLWADYREAALPHSLRACWSTPIFSSQGKVIATFALYYREPHSPSPHDQEIIEQITHLAGVAIERKLTQEALRRSESYLAEAQRLTRTGSWAWSPATEELLYWSDEMCRIFGSDPQQGPPSMQMFWERVHPADRDSMDKIIRRSVREKIGYVHDLRFVLPGGTVRHIQTIGHPLLDAAGEIVELFGTTIDVTERKQAEEALRRSEAYLAEAQRLTRTGSLAWNPVNHNTIHCSDEVFRMFGLDSQKGIPAIAELLQRVHPEDRERVTGDSRRGDGDKVGRVVDYRVRLPDGTIKYIHSIRYPVLNDSGELTEFLGTLIDVTEQKRAEEDLHRSEAYLAEAQRLTHTGSWAFDPVTTKTLYWSEEMFRIFAFNPHQGLPPTETFWERIHPEDRDNMYEIIRNAVYDKKEYAHDHRIVLPDGTVKQIHAIGHPVIDAAGEIVEFVGTSIDVTERTRTEAERERLRQLEEDLARINRVSTLGELAASIAHEVKQPIAAVITSADACLRWLTHNPPNLERARLAVTRVKDDGTRAAEVINRLRSLYIQAGPPEREPVDVNEVAGEMLALLRGEAKRHSISMRTELSPQLPKTKADRVQLQQVFMNLMLNGIEAMKDTGGELTIKSERTGDGQLLISVRDTGIGLPAEGADRIFDAFYTTKPQGTGMGLAITRSIVESHGGRLWATANHGPGAIFQFTLSTTAEANA